MTLHSELIYIVYVSHEPMYTQDEDSPIKQLLGLSFNERMNIIREARIVVRGISGKVLKMTNFNKLMQIVNVIGNMPQVAGAIDPIKFVCSKCSNLEKIKHLESICQKYHIINR